MDIPVEIPAYTAMATFTALFGLMSLEERNRGKKIFSLVLLGSWCFVCGFIVCLNLLTLIE